MQAPGVAPLQITANHLKMYKPAELRSAETCLTAPLPPVYHAVHGGISDGAGNGAGSPNSTPGFTPTMSAASTSVPYLVIGTPCYGKQVTTNYAGSLLKLQAACHERGIHMQVHMLGGDALITRRDRTSSRNFSRKKPQRICFSSTPISASSQPRFSA